MSIDRGRGETSGLVDLERGLIHRDVFANAEIYEAEKERVFARTWLFVGHESQIPAPGDFVLGRMGEESVILNRDAAGRIHVLLNNCRHRVFGKLSIVFFVLRPLLIHLLGSAVVVQYPGIVKNSTCADDKNQATAKQRPLPCPAKLVSERPDTRS